MQVKFLGYDIVIIYDDYDRFETFVESLDEIENICKSLENRDDTFEIEYKKKYQLEDGSFLYSKREHFSLENKNIPKKELLLRKFRKISAQINNSIEVNDKDIVDCYNILYEILHIDI
ncbi:hypothetical protein RZR97_07925 [Hydrogenimonas thermophila]|uniref:hypothetical protein n=1 Tax=Hydrogenimonas thermophila TaxID=223786 RepID=UPI002937380D|nr:hypothetical protein [Hydrogenimonas thermophila]WOE69038.1 hypothetical protein RZR91_07950 [Hydrogenimonas thermophila]WOE71548.1 hypothetical protein RZR97_07925 [Hydrogenimonas thermophila]